VQARQHEIRFLHRELAICAVSEPGTSSTGAFAIYRKMRAFEFAPLPSARRAPGR